MRDLLIAVFVLVLNVVLYLTLGIPEGSLLHFLLRLGVIFALLALVVEIILFSIGADSK